MAYNDWVHQSRPNVKSATLAKSVIIRDVNPDYALLNNNNILVEDDEALRKQIRHLLSTPIGTEDFEPTYGSNLPFRLMDPIGDLTAYLMETDVILAIRKWLGNKILLINPRITPYVDSDFYLATLPYLKITDSTLKVYSFEFGA
jgi:phage baseplate assembly protein W